MAPVSPEAIAARLRTLLVDCGGSVKLLEGVERVLESLSKSWQDEARNFSGQTQKVAVTNSRAYGKALGLIRQARLTLMQETF